jgi:hypothetical protein
VLRRGVLVAERRTVQQADGVNVAIDRWLEAELEMQRATGEEPGGPKRGEVRIAARDGVFMRFGVFGETREHDFVPELGPFAVVVVGPRAVLGDGVTLAIRPPSELAPWELTAGAGADHAGVHKPDLAFRTPMTRYHQAIAPSPQPGALPRPIVRPSGVAPLEPTAVPPAAPIARPAPVETPAQEAAPAPATAAPTEIVAQPQPLAPVTAAVTPDAPSEPTFRPPGEEMPYVFVERRRVQPEEPTPVLVERRRGELTDVDRELIDRMERDRAEETLRARIHTEDRRRLGPDDDEEEATTWASRHRSQAANASDEYEEVAPRFEWGPALWRLRFAVIGVLLLLVGVYVLTAIRGGATAGAVVGQVQTVGIAQRFGSARWDFVVNGVQRVPTAGGASARLGYYIVRLGATAKGDGRLVPSDFSLIDANGTEYPAESATSDAYQGPANPTSPYVWPDQFPSGRSVTFTVVFDVDPSLPRGTLLKISDLPNTRVRLD